MRLRNIRVGFVLVLAVYGLSACAQTQPSTELGQVRQEMEQLKQEYEQQRLAYEQRLEKLEEQLKRMETSSAAPAACFRRDGLRSNSITGTHFSGHPEFRCSKSISTVAGRPEPESVQARH